MGDWEYRFHPRSLRFRSHTIDILRNGTPAAGNGRRLSPQKTCQTCCEWALNVAVEQEIENNRSRKDVNVLLVRITLLEPQTAGGTKICTRTSRVKQVPFSCLVSSTHHSGIWVSCKLGALNPSCHHPSIILARLVPQYRNQ
jgi:hypothetical protein